MHLQTGGSTAAILNRTTSGAAILQLYDSSGRKRAEIYGDYGRYIQYFGDTDNHISTDLGNDTTRSFLTLNSPDGSSDIFLDTLPANGSRFNSKTEFNANVTVNSVIDVTTRRCYANLSQSGWYRVLSYKTGIADRSAGHPSFIVDLSITRYSTSTVGEVHSIRLFVNYNNNVHFVDEQSQSSSQIIDKIRYTINGGNAYVDIHYNINSGNGVCVNFDVDIHSSLQGYFTAESLQAVGNDPSGETVLTTYDFAENTEAVGTVVGASGFTPDEIDVKRSGRVVYVHFFVQNVSIAANTETVIATLSGVPFPSKNIRWLAGGGAHSYGANTPVYAILGTSGRIAVQPPSAISAVNITVSYIV
jgi:hypothetical protein